MKNLPNKVNYVSKFGKIYFTMSLYSGEVNSFIEVFEKYPEAASVFNKYPKKDLFSLNWKQTKQILDSLKPIPKCLLEIIPELGMCFLAKYMMVTFYSFFPEELLQSYLLLIDKLPTQDLDLVIHLIVSRLSVPQRKAAIFKLPDCGATFHFLGSIIDNEELFFTAFQRIFSSLNLVPSNLQPLLISLLRKSIESGVARQFITDIIEMAIHCKPVFVTKRLRNWMQKEYQSSSVLDIVLTAICDFYPSSLIKTDSKALQNALQLVFKSKDVPFSALKLVLLTDSQILLTFQQIYSFYTQGSAFLFEYILRLSETDSLNTWKLILSKISQMEVNMQTREFIISCYENYLIACHSNAIYTTAIQSSGTIEWFASFTKTMADSIYHIAIFSLFILFFRSFAEMAKQISNFPDFQQDFENAINKSREKQLFYEAIFWLLDSSRERPFDKVVNFQEIMKIKFQAPSSPFVFEVVPTILNTLLKIAIADSTPKDLPKSPTPRRMSYELERTHSQVKLLLDDTNDDNVTEFNESDDEANLSIICPVELENTIKIKPLLTMFLTNMIPMYEVDSLSFLIHSLSSSQCLLPIVPFAEKNDLCFRFLTRALALSCPFHVFATFYEKISHDFKKTLDFLAGLAEYSQLVTDFLYITSPIPLSTTIQCSTLLLWVRPLIDSNILTIQTKFGDLMINMSPTEIKFPINGSKMNLPPKIGGWIMLSIIFSGNVIHITANAMPIKLTYGSDVGMIQNFTIGSATAHFDLQSVRVFKVALSEDDLMHIFALGPNYMEFVNHNLNQMDSQQIPAFYTNTGYVSSHYLPFISSFVGKNLENNVMSLLELSLSPPYKMVRHLARGPQKAAMAITVDRRRSYSFMNSLHCHGGLHLLLHFAGEVILKKPELSPYLWKLLSRLFNTYPDVHRFFEEKHAYSLVGHLLWSGTIKLDECMEICLKNFDGKFHITNPFVLKEWILEGLIFHSESAQAIENLINSLENPRNFAIIKSAKTFSKLINLLCSSCRHSENFLKLITTFAVKLTEPSTAQENAQLVFDRLVLYHFKFDKEDYSNNKSELLKFRSTDRIHKQSSTEIQPITSIALINVLSQILTQFNDVKVDLELLLPAVVTSVPIVQTSLVIALIRHLSANYLQLLGYILKILPYIDGIDMAIFDFLNSTPEANFVQLTTCFFAIVCHKESCEYLDELCGFVTEKTTATQDVIVIAMNQILDVIRFTETTEEMPLFDNAPATTMMYMSLLLDHAIIFGQPDLLFKFFLSLFSIPGVAVYRLASVCFTIMTNLLALIFKRNQSLNASISQALAHVTTFASFLIHRIRLTPGAINPFLLNLIQSFVNSLISVVNVAQNFDSTNRLVNFLADLFHVDVPSSILQSIKSQISSIAKIQKAKRYTEMCERMDESSMMTPNKFLTPFQDDLDNYEKKWQKKDGIDRIGLFSISCRSIHHQTQAAVTLNLYDTDGDFVIDLWHDTFHILQFPGSLIYNQCPTKWMVSDRSLNFQQRSILIPMNPSIDKPYLQYWKAKYKSDPEPEVRLTIKEVFKYTPVSLHMANDVEFSSHAFRLSGISNYDGVLIVLHNIIRFYQRTKATSETLDIVLTIPINKIVSLKLKAFRHQPTGVELTCKDATCYIFAFDTVNLRDIFVDVMESRQLQTIKTVNKKELDMATKHWVEGQLSNFDYLLYLNQVSGRSWYDFTQYPIFPWVIKNYKSDTIDLNNPETFRDFTFPIFAQTEEQKEQCMSYYSTTEALSNEPHCTPNYISNVGSTIYFLVRAEPFTNEEISFQNGSLDAADRTFQSFDISYSLMTAPGNKNALELIPEFYFHPELLKNINEIEFPISPITGKTVGDVVLPPWAPTTREFVQIMKKALESPYVSSQLNDWIDLVWGYRRRGEAALERCNVFQGTVYQFDPRDVIGDRILFKALSGQIHNCGQAAAQIFTAPHPKRNDNNSPLKGELVFHSLRKPIASERNVLQFSLASDRWIPISSDKTPLKALRLVGGNLEANRNGQISTAVAFTDDIAVTCFDVMGTTIVTGHTMPIINLWKVRDNLELFLTLRGHLVAISAVSIFAQPWSMLAAGHEDGCVSLFSMCPTRFLRVLNGGSKMRVSFVKICSSNGDFIVVQAKEKMSVISLWSVNGEFVNTITLETEILDAVATSFVEGVRPNYIFLLGADSIIYAFAESDLVLIGTFELNHPQPVSLFHEKEKSVLFVMHADNFLSLWRIV